ncbi:outer membrane protein [Labrys wisconsinensis]|uniref:Opacity protein-like surface antigen n=1 Tax=Labrys wisconsinensis TaxID=425677 RepID=A0ABU0JAE0_9HYPH|nr:outer membrane beta-barrel protein [Labrys wisconsinensis]MDQ0471233.1 opacity protein-like surface antigen [Labrys wisconsinensis]
MANLKTHALASALVLAASAASAADVPMVEQPPPPPVAAPDFGGWYLRGDIGFSNQHVDKIENVLDAGASNLNTRQKSFDAAPFGGVGVGYRFNEWLRADITGEYRGNAGFNGYQTFNFVDGLGNDRVGVDRYTASKSEWTGMLNAYVDLGTWYGITPFIGAGIGASYNTISNFQDNGMNDLVGGGDQINSSAYAKDSSKWNLAWALQAGLAYEVTPGLTMELAYRYINLGDARSGDIISYDGTNTINNPEKFKNLTSHDIKLGLRWALGEPIPAAEPEYPTLTRKY